MTNIRIQCSECGVEIYKSDIIECPFCEQECCDNCIEEHEKECRNDNGQFGVGA